MEVMGRDAGKLHEVEVMEEGKNLKSHKMEQINKCLVNYLPDF